MPTDEQIALWAAIRANPLDDTPRLVYADWLQEHGDEARAEFIRVQCALAKLHLDRRKHRKERPALEARDTELLAAHEQEWLVAFRRLLPSPTYRTAERLHRGFAWVNSLSLLETSIIAAAEATLEPVEVDSVIARSTEYRHKHLLALSRWSGATGVRQLEVRCATDETMTVVTTCGRFRLLDTLTFTIGTLSDAALVELANWPAATSLRRVDFSGNPITHAGAFVLADCPYLDDLVRLDLTGTQINPDGRERLRERFGDRVHFNPEVE